MTGCCIFPMSSGLSGSCETAKALAQDYDGRVLVVDDHRITLTLARSIRNAVSLLDQGKTAEEVKAILEGGDASSIYVAVSTLEYLRKSGRVTAAGAAMATILHIKPVLQIQGGSWTPIERCGECSTPRKTMIAALRHDLATRFSGMRMAVYSGYSGSDRTVGDTWHDEVQAAFPEYKVPPSVSPASEHLLPHRRGCGGPGLRKGVVTEGRKHRIEKGKERVFPTRFFFMGKGFHENLRNSLAFLYFSSL